MSGSQNPQVLCVCVSEQPEKKVLSHGIQVSFSECVCSVICVNSLKSFPDFYLSDSSVSCGDAEVESEETLEEN